MTDAVAIILCLIVLPIPALLIGIHIYAYVSIFAGSSQLRNLLKKQNRVLSLKEAKEKVKTKQGMIIVDAPTIGWNVDRVWWSPTTEFAPRSESGNKEKICADEDMVNYKKFIEPTAGVASLIDGFVFTQRTRKYLRRHFGLDNCLFILSGAALTQEKMDEFQTAKDKGEARVE